MGKDKRIDLVGQKFGKLVVLKDEGERDNSNNVLWLCRCECGVEKLVSSRSLRKGLTKSCGCIQCPNLVGQRFGNLLVLNKKKINKNITWECECICGNKIYVVTANLNNGHTKSCGCGFSGKNHPNFDGYGEIGKSYFNNIKYSSIKRKLEFNITNEYIWYLFLKQERKCALSGVELKFSTTSRSFDGTASLDRIDSGKGYVEGNLQWIHKDINFMKQEQNEKDFINWCHIISDFNNRNK